MHVFILIAVVAPQACIQHRHRLLHCETARWKYGESHNQSKFYNYFIKRDKWKQLYLGYFITIQEVELTQMLLSCIMEIVGASRNEVSATKSYIAVAVSLIWWKLIPEKNHHKHYICKKKKKIF